MILYNSLSRKKEEFIPNDKKEVKIYTCGPTVYHYAHIGNLRTYIFEDVLVKALEYLGYPVKRAMNITDVGHLAGDTDTGEDKMLKGAEREHKTVMEIAKFYTEAFQKDFEALHLRWPEIVVPATSCIDTYIEMIRTLLEKGFAYQSHGNVYFDISKLKEYNVFNNQSKEEMVVGAREGVEDDMGKRNAQDFALWFTKSKFENQALVWDSPWGVGYPGWHIECSGINLKYLGEYLDIHCGGVDNKFPHHTNEIAQSESYIGHKWCNYWFHVAYLNLADGKMSKSKGEFLTVTTLKEKGYEPEIYKLFCLQSNYRKELLFSYEGMDMAKQAYQKIASKVRSLNVESITVHTPSDTIQEFQQNFADALANDLNTPMAVTVLFDVLKSNLTDDEKAYLIADFDTVLGLDLKDKIGKPEEATEDNIDAELKTYILQKIEERAEAKKNKDYAKADEIRNELLEKGIQLVDTKEGVTYQKV